MNASPIIVLARIRRTDLLLRQLYRQVIIPTAVAEEIRAGQVADPAQAWLDSDGNDLVNTVGEIDPVIAAWDLGAGESEVLYLGTPESQSMKLSSTTEVLAIAHRHSGYPFAGSLGSCFSPSMKGAFIRWNRSCAS